MDMMMNMSMGSVFKFTDHLSHFLFRDINIHSGVGVFGACVVLAIVAVVIEGIKLLRAILQKRANMNPLTYAQTDKNISERSPLMAPLLIPASTSQIKSRRLKYHSFQTVAYLCQVITGYLLMLAVMSYNAWIFIAVVLASGLGYFLFGASRDYIVGRSETAGTFVHEPPESQIEHAERMRHVTDTAADYHTIGSSDGPEI